MPNLLPRSPLSLFLCWILTACSAVTFAQTLPTQTSTIFSGSGNCETCHAPGPPNLLALRAPNGDDISPVTLWRSTMMANAAKDPFWQAKVTAEVAAAPHLQTMIEDKCTTCHSPLGRTEAIANGAPFYTLAEMQMDTLALDGVSCTACHQIKNTNFGADSSFSGNYIIRNERLIYGPYIDPLEQPMITYTHYLPIYGPHMRQSELCATCHTLFTPFLDNNGQIAGESAEQVPYLEWKNSVYPAQDIQCQTCHVPETPFPVVISNFPDSLQYRAPFFKHYFVGANVFMLNMLKNHAGELGVTATAEQFDSTIARTTRQLRERTVNLSGAYRWSSADTLQLSVAVENRAGHKFPTAYPSRRAWLQVRLLDVQNNVLFESGAYDAQSGEIVGLDMPYEPHHDLIRSPGEVAVYEAIAHDVDNQVTYRLLRTAGHIKDNRIPPHGFTTQGANYDSAAIEGLAALDPNFNRSAGTEGTATDTVHYHIGGLNPQASYRVQIALRYQSISPRFAQDLFQYATAEVQRFQNFYNQADKRPFTIDSLQIPISVTGLAGDAPELPATVFLINAYPNPFNPQATVAVDMQSSGELRVEIFNVLGQSVSTLFSGSLPAGRHSFTWNPQEESGGAVSSGVYLIHARLQTLQPAAEAHQVRKVVYLR